MFSQTKFIRCIDFDLGPGDILKSKRVDVIFFAGMWQRTALRKTLFRKPTMRFPGSLLKLRKDREAGLTRKNITVWATNVEVGTVFSQTMS